MPDIYTTGYAGAHPEDLRRWLEALDGVCVDIRYRPTSRDPRWRQPQLAARLGARYVHVPALGNRHYRGGSIALVDLDAGLAQIAQEPRPVVLLCGCRDATRCHRTTVAAALRARGLTVTEQALPVRADRFVWRQGDLRLDYAPWHPPPLFDCGEEEPRA